MLNVLNRSDALRYPIMDPSRKGKKLERIKCSEQKTFLLLGAALADKELSDLEYSVRQAGVPSLA